METEKRLIDVSNENVKVVLGKYPYYPDEIWKFKAMTERFPTVYAMEVVRCKDCKYYCQDKINGAICRHPELDYEIECYDHWINTNPDDFCSYGERKDGDGNG